MYHYGRGRALGWLLTKLPVVSAEHSSVVFHRLDSELPPRGALNQPRKKLTNVIQLCHNINGLIPSLTRNHNRRLMIRLQLF